MNRLMGSICQWTKRDLKLHTLLSSYKLKKLIRRVRHCLTGNIKILFPFLSLKNDKNYVFKYSFRYIGNYWTYCSIFEGSTDSGMRLNETSTHFFPSKWHESVLCTPGQGYQFIFIKYLKLTKYSKLQQFITSNDVVTLTLGSTLANRYFKGSHVFFYFIGNYSSFFCAAHIQVSWLWPTMSMPQNLSDFSSQQAPAESKVAQTAFRWMQLLSP